MANESKKHETNLNQVFADAVERIKREGHQEGFVAGWQAAIAAITKAAAELSKSEIPITAPGDAFVISPGRTAELGLTPGTTQHYVYQAVVKRQGMTGMEVISAVIEAGHRVNPQNIRTALFRLKNKKLLAARHGRWFLPTG